MALDVTWKEIFKSLKTIAKTQDDGIPIKNALIYEAELKIKKSEGLIFGSYDNYSLTLVFREGKEKYELKKNGKLIFETYRYINEDEKNTYRNEVYHESFDDALNELRSKYLDGYRKINHED